jgi:putative intracellular protease/amidase
MKLRHLFLGTLALLTIAGGGGVSSAAPSKGKILVIASQQDKMTLKNGKEMNVGFFLNEFAVPSLYLADHGYTIQLATPEGKKPPMDKGSNDAKFFKGGETERARAEKFATGLKPISFAQAISDFDSYKAVFVPGGHAPMTDLMQNKELGTILQKAHAAQKPTAFICHGPVASLAALPDAAAYRKALVSDDVAGAMQYSKNWIYNGYRMTVLSDAEEWPNEVGLGGEMPYHVEQALQIAGANMEVSAPLYASHVVHDREVITGQNPASDIALAEELMKAIENN